MKHNLTIVQITAREHNRFDWFFDSLAPQLCPGDDVRIVIVDARLHDPLPRSPVDSVVRTLPKPTVFQGAHRLTREDWWAASNARNTGICLCATQWIAFLDDRCVLLPGWLDGIRAAMEGEYAVFGAYEKRTGIVVENGVITHGGIVTGVDSREAYVNDHGMTNPFPCPGEWAFGCSLALPLDWALQVNGFEELMDSLSAEDVVFGRHLRNNGLDLRYDKTMKIIEDRTPEFLGTPMKRSSKERFHRDTQDKGHRALEWFSGQKGTLHQWNLRGIRDHVLKGGEFPIPTGPTTDWFDGQLISELMP